MAFSRIQICQGISLFVALYSVLLLTLAFSRLKFRSEKRWSRVIVYIILIAIYSSTYEAITFFYGVSFVLFYVMFSSAKDVLRIGLIVKTIFWLYFVELILGQISVALGLLNTANINEFGVSFGPFGSLYQFSNNSYRQMSLATEPAHAAFCISLISTVLFRTIIRENRTKKLTYWSVYIYMMMAFNSTSSFVLLPLPFLPILPNKMRRYLPFVFVSIVGITSIFSGQSTRLLGLINFFSSIDDLAVTDGSSFYRVAPLYFYLQEVNLADILFWIGHGINSANVYFSNILVPSGQYTISIPLLPSLLFDYGLIGSVLIIVAVTSNLSWYSNVSFIFLGMFALFNLNFNTQLFWLYVIMFTCVTNDSFNVKYPLRLLKV